MWEIFEGSIINIIDAVYLNTKADADAMLVHARSLIALAMIIFYSIKAYGIMTGEEEIQFVKFLRPVAILLVVLLWPNFVSIIEEPIRAIESGQKAKALQKIELVNTLNKERDRRVTELMYIMMAEADVAETNYFKLFTPSGILEYIEESGESITKYLSGIQGLLASKVKYYMMWFLTWVFQTLSGFLMIFIFYLRMLMSGLLYFIGPFAFALSVFPAFENSWKKWVSRFIGVSLYGVLGYLAISAGTGLLIAVMQADVAYLTAVAATGSSDKVLAAFLSNDLITTSTAYIIGLLVTGFSMLSVPLVAGWFTSDASAGALGSKAMKAATEAAKQAASLVKKVATAGVA